MVTRYGMNDQFGMVALETVNNQYLGGDTSLACSPEDCQSRRRRGDQAGKRGLQKGHGDFGSE